VRKTVACFEIKNYSFKMGLTFKGKTERKCNNSRF